MICKACNNLYVYIYLYSPHSESKTFLCFWFYVVLVGQYNKSTAEDGVTDTKTQH